MSWAERLPAAADAVLSLRARSVTLSLGHGGRWRHHGVAIAGAATATTEVTTALPGVAALRSALAAVVAQALALQGGGMAGGVAGGVAGGAGRRWRVLLAPPWLQLQALPWSDLLLDAAGARSFALAALARQGVDAAPDDLLAIDPEPPLDAPRSLAHIDAAVLAALHDAAASAGARLHSLLALPLLAAAWCGRQQPGASAGVWLDGTLWLHTLAPGRPLPVHAAQPAQPAGHLAPDALAALLRRSALQLPALAAPAAVPVLDLAQRPTARDTATPATTAAAIDAPWPQPLAWPEGIDTPAALDSHLAATAGPAFDLLPAAAALLPGMAAPWRGGTLAQRLPRPLAWAAALAAGVAAMLLLADAAAPPPPAAVTAAATPAAPALPARTDWAAAQQAVAQLHLPLAPLLRALAPPASLPVRLVALDLSRRETASTRTAADSGNALLRLTAEAASVQDMAAYADLLAGRRGMHAVQLVRHQQAVAAGAGQRFVLELQWQP